MVIGKRLNFKVGYNTCEFKCIDEFHVSESYVNGLKEQKKYIINNPSEITIKYQKRYVRKIIDSDNECIFGLWVNGEMIGTAGCQNLFNGRPTTMGVFLFNKKHRGQGYGKIIIWASCSLLNHEFNINNYSASMFKKNFPSFYAFLSIGFKEKKSTDRTVTLLLSIDNILKPKTIKSIKYTNA